VKGVVVLPANVREQGARALLHFPERGLIQDLGDVSEAGFEVIEDGLPADRLVALGAGQKPFRQNLRVTEQRAA
jgi:hypothetical protein